MPILETEKALAINILGNFQDTVNTYGSGVRLFMMNRGEFDVRNRKWNIDLAEIGLGINPVNVEIVYGLLYNWYAVDDARDRKSVV